MHNWKWYLLLAASCVACAIALKRDAYMRSVTGTGDLRNRIVGARLLKDGTHDPYTYHYKAGDSLRYYDQQNFGNSTISNITASPFFLKILSPICDLPQSLINQLCYVTLIIGVLLMVILVFIKNKTLQLIAISAGIFASVLYWQSWPSSLIGSQTYFHFLYIFFLVYLLFEYKPSIITALLCGLLMLALPLLKVNFGFLFLPLLLNFKKYKTAISVAVICGIAYIGMVINNTYTKNVWKQYFMALRVHVADTQGISSFQQNEVSPQYTVVEGLNRILIENKLKIKPVPIREETNNFFNLIWFAFEKSIDRRLLLAIMLSLIGAVMYYAFQANHKETLANYQIFLIGFALYIISDFFGPIFRHPYYLMVWIIPVAIVLLNIKSVPRITWVFFTIGCLLYVLPYNISKVQLTVGELCLVIAITIAGLEKKIMRPSLTL